MDTLGRDSPDYLDGTCVQSHSAADSRPTDAAANLTWDTFTKYDSAGRIVLSAAPSAVTGYDDTYADLLHAVSNNYQYLSDSAGLIGLMTSPHPLAALVLC